MNGSTGDDLMSTDEVLSTLGISNVTLHRYIRARRLRPCGAIRFEGRSKLTNAFHREDVDRVAKENAARKKGRPTKDAKEEEQDEEPIIALWTKTFWPLPDGTWRVDDRPMVTFSEDQYDALERNRLAYFESRIAAIVASDLADDVKADIVGQLEEFKAAAPLRKAACGRESAKLIAATLEIGARKGTSQQKEEAAGADADKT